LEVLLQPKFGLIADLIAARIIALTASMGKFLRTFQTRSDMHFLGSKAIEYLP
jgi:hypothetical protein